MKKRPPAAQVRKKPPAKAVAIKVEPAVRRRKRRVAVMPHVEGVEDGPPIPLLVLARHYSLTREAMHRTLLHFEIEMIGRPRGIGGRGGTDWFVSQSGYRKLMACMKGQAS